MRRILLAVAVLLLLAPAARAAEGDVRLSDERELSRYAHANGLFGVRVKPVAGARRVDRLRYRTEDGLPEVYLALRSRTTRGAEWVEIRLPGRPNGRAGWVPREALGPLRKVTTSLVVDRSRFRAALYRDGERIWSSRVGVGAPGTPTPKGRFYIRQKLRNLGGSSAYGPWAFGTSAYSVLSDWPGGGVIGIHGTNQPALLPGRVSHGCVRVPNAAISRLARLMPVGTPVRIR